MTIQPAQTGRGLEARIVHRENLGSDLFLHCRVEGIEAPLIAREDPLRVDAFPIGAWLRIGLPVGQVLVFDASGQRVRACSTPRAAAAA